MGFIRVSTKVEYFSFFLLMGGSWVCCHLFGKRVGGDWNLKANGCTSSAGNFSGEQVPFEELRSPSCISTGGTMVQVKFWGSLFPQPAC